MNKVLVVGSRRDLQGEIQNLSNYKGFFSASLPDTYEVSSALLDDLIFDIAPQKFSIHDSLNGHELTEYDVIFIRGKIREDMDLVYAISQYSHLNHIKCLNDCLTTLTISKFAQAIKFFMAKAPFPRTVMGSAANIKLMVENGSLGLPLVYKDRLGSHGEDNYLVNSPKDLDGKGRWGMLAQPLISNDADYRILLAGNRQLVIKRKAVAGSHLNNTSQGGQAELALDLSPSIINQARKLAVQEGYIVAGADVIIERSSGKHYFLEINSQPQIMSGSFLEEKKRLLRDFVSDIT
jgi:glutathione synthase/RimK-type ligase-like ATP-grasp enzyme